MTGGNRYWRNEQCWSQLQTGRRNNCFQTPALFPLDSFDVNSVFCFFDATFTVRTRALAASISVRYSISLRPRLYGVQAVQSVTDMKTDCSFCFVFTRGLYHIRGIKVYCSLGGVRRAQFAIINDTRFQSTSNLHIARLPNTRHQVKIGE